MDTNDYIKTFYSSPNQKIGRINKPKYKWEGMKFMYVGIEEIREAAKELSPSALKLYLYFVENEDEWEFALSPKDFQNAYDLAESTYRKAKQELIDKGYIEEHGKNHFDFYSSPKKRRVTLEDLRKEANRLGQIIQIYDSELLEQFLEKAKKIQQKSKDEQKDDYMTLVKTMQAAAKKLQEENSLF